MFKGASQEQDARFPDKQRKLKASLQFPKEFGQQVRVSQVAIDTLRPWAAERARQLLQIDDPVVVDMLFNMLTENDTPDPRDLQIAMMSFMGAAAKDFVLELWRLMLSAVENGTGVPSAFLNAKVEQMKRAPPAPLAPPPAPPSAQPPAAAAAAALPPPPPPPPPLPAVQIASAPAAPAPAKELVDEHGRRVVQRHRRSRSRTRSRSRSRSHSRSSSESSRSRSRSRSRRRHRHRSKRHKHKRRKHKRSRSRSRSRSRHRRKPSRSRSRSRSPRRENGVASAPPAPAPPPQPQPQPQPHPPLGSPKAISAHASVEAARAALQEQILREKALQSLQRVQSGSSAAAAH